MMKNLKLNVMKVDEDGNIEHGWCRFLGQV
jgi:hypothetical protein